MKSLKGTEMISEAWRYQNLIHMAFDLGCSIKEIRKTFEGTPSEIEFQEKQLQIVIQERKNK